MSLTKVLSMVLCMGAGSLVFASDPPPNPTPPAATPPAATAAMQHSTQAGSSIH